ncbi:hypothetical protein LCGC14_0356730 [marine sediment metagenome]|uniref:Gamma-carboxygeranoyl-CoA hydratase n=1 Tax=marine sediment metagenome TaxID=412755 RepID=A0A0F9WHF7_9ZZZZ
MVAVEKTSVSAFNTLEVEIDTGGIGTLWLNRPEKNNAFNAEMIAELLMALSEIQMNNELRFLILRGRGKHFSAGADLAWMLACAQLDYDANLNDARELGQLMASLAQLKIPTLAVVHGAAFGGAMGLISCCDMAIGTEDSLFSLSEVRIGLLPAVISPYVAQAIGPRAARRYALTAERFDGKRAQKLGLLAEVYPAAALDEALAGWVENLLLNSPQAMRSTKALMQKVKHGDLTSELRSYTESAIASIRVSKEGQEGLAAFLDKRKPQWLRA